MFEKTASTKTSAAIVGTPTAMRAFIQGRCLWLPIRLAEHGEDFGNSKPRPDEKELAIKAVRQVREWGGALEHPATSSLWKEMPLPMPGEIDMWGGFTICVDQFWWGHKAQKRTFLYICGIRPTEVPAHPIRFDAIEYVVCASRNHRVKYGNMTKKYITKRERESTPLDFAKWLIQVAQLCHKQKVA